MRNHNAIIKGVSYYHPNNTVTNDYFIKHFKEQGKDISGLLKTTGRNTRYISEDLDETIVTMGIEAVKKVLDKTKVNPKDLNLIAFSSGTPEYFAPSNAIKIHDSIRAGQQATVYDVNANCVGMLVTLEQVCRSMRDNQNIKYALIVGSDQLTRYSRYNEAIAYSNFGDSACALILENVYNTDRGFIDSDAYTNSSSHDKILLPAKGLTSTIHDKKLSVRDRLIQWKPFDLNGAFFSAKISIEKLLDRNHLTTKDIKKYYVSQFAKKNIDYMCKNLKEDINKFVFVGDEFGYTGTTSPFLAFAKHLETEGLNPGDHVIFWSVGAGTTCSCILYKY